jgi:lysophospholipid acyltransferase
MAAAAATTSSFAVADFLAKTAGIDVALVRFALALFGSVALSIPNRSLPSANWRHAYALVTGVALLWFAFGRGGWVHPFVVSTLVYLILRFTRRVRALDGWRHWVAAMAALGYLTWRHYNRDLSNVHAASIDDIATQMVLAVKLYTLAYNLHDGTGSGKALIDKKIAEAETALERAAVDNDQEGIKKANSVLRIFRDRKERAIPGMPSILAYYGFVFNFPTILVGPSFEITEYLRSQSNWTSSNFPAYSRVLPAVITLISGVFLMAVNVVGLPLVPVSGIYTLSQDTKKYPLWWHFGYTFISLTLVRIGYYAVWKIAEAASILGGFGYKGPTGVDGKAEIRAANAGRSLLAKLQAQISAWEGASNADFFKVELSTGLSNSARYWNKFTQSWLERYIFLRAPRTLGLNRWLTFFGSAFWHGVLPTYYMGFLSLPLMQESSKKVYSTLRPRLMKADGKTPLFSKANPIYWLYAVFRGAVSLAALTFALTPFNLFEVDKSLAVWRRWYFAGLWIPVLLFASCFIVDKVKPIGGRRGGRGGKKDVGSSAAAAAALSERSNENKED